MAAHASVKKSNNKRKKNRENKIHLVFDAAKRKEFLTGFHKRKLQRKKEAKEKLEKELKEERRRLKLEAKESYKKLVVSHRPIPELETLLKEEYEEDNATVKIEELSTDNIARESNWIGVNKVKERESDEDEEIPGMGLKEKRSEKQTFESEKDVKKLLKKKATSNVKKSKVFQMKNKIEKQKQQKKSRQQKRLKEKTKERQEKKRRKR